MTNRVSIVGLIIGLTILISLLLFQDIGAIIFLLFDTGVSLLLLPIAWIPALFFAALAWRYLLPESKLPTYWQSLIAIWIGRAVNSLLPVATIGGEIVKARLMILWKKNAIYATASVIIDKTVQVIAVIVWGLIGIILLSYGSTNPLLAKGLLLGIGLLSIGAFGFYLLQDVGLASTLTKLGEKLINANAFEKIKVNAKDVDIAILEIYRRKKQFVYAVIYKSLGLMIQTGELWLACYLFQQPISILDAMMLRSITSTVSDVAFLIPNGYGIQEGAFILVGMLLGIGADTALSISLALRMRELLVEVPALVYWHRIESRQS